MASLQPAEPPPPAPDVNPKMLKLIEGAKLAHGGVLVVLDDDTRLPDGGLEQCLPYLRQPHVGLAFGLPYYVSFQNVWSSLIAYFVNSNSLLTYIPYLQLTKPFTINGMFYAIRREVFEQVGGFAGLEGFLADDFAIARRIQAHGYELAQTPLRHAISTHVAGASHYLSLMQRWFAGTTHRDAQDPYFLYAAGNIGSALTEPMPHLTAFPGGRF